MGTMMDKLFPALMMLGIIAPIAAIVVAIILYVRHRNRVARERRVPAVAYVSAIIICGAIAGYLGLVFGIRQACSVPKAANLCGLWGFFVSGPISCAVAIVLVGVMISLRRPTPRRPAQPPDYFAEGDNSD
jgi:hypothetical protein